MALKQKLYINTIDEKVKIELMPDKKWVASDFIISVGGGLLALMYLPLVFGIIVGVLGGTLGWYVYHLSYFDSVKESGTAGNTFAIFESLRRSSIGFIAHDACLEYLKTRRHLETEGLRGSSLWERNNNEWEKLAKQMRADHEQAIAKADDSVVGFFYQRLEGVNELRQLEAGS